jgi:hypothetical protein
VILPAEKENLVEIEERADGLKNMLLPSQVTHLEDSHRI